MYKNLTRGEKRAQEEHDLICKKIRDATISYVPNESDFEKQQRKSNLLKDFTIFSRYYFAHLIDSDFAYFHREAATRIEQDPKIFAVLEWPREHAKSVFTDIMLTLYLYAKGEVTGVVMVSATKDKAANLLSDIQAELTSNELWLNDFGNLAKYGDWSDGEFSLVDNTGFWAFGRKQSPRGIRKAAKRPNLCIVDDIDDKELVKNIDRVIDIKDWLLGDLYYALPIKGCRFIMIGNRFHKDCVLAHVIGDVEEGDITNENITYHSKVFALENPRTRKMDLNGEPAWKERYSKEEIEEKIKKSTNAPAMREFFHQHIQEGKTFKRAWVNYIPMLPHEAYSAIVQYGDPSYKSTATSDYKAIVVVGKVGKHKKNNILKEGSLHILAAYIEKTTPLNMVRAFYDFYEEFEGVQSWIEANFIQDLLGKDEFYNEGIERGYQIPIKQDTSRKNDKRGRIENITPLFERNLIYFNENKRNTIGMKRLVEQLIAFPSGNDDGPDALQGAIDKLQKKSRKSNSGHRTGKYIRNKKRS